MAAQDTPLAEDAQRAFPAASHPAPNADQPEATAAPRTEKAPDRASLVGWLCLVLIGLGEFAVMTALIASKFVFPFDQPLLDAGAQLSGYMVAWKDLSNSANFPLIAVGVAIVFGLLLFRRWKEAIVVVMLLVAVTAGSELVKQLIARPRPPNYGEDLVGVVYSFPSGHVLEAVTFTGHRRPGLAERLAAGLADPIPAVFTAMVIMVAIARVAVGSHYPSDVLASAFGGLGFVAVFAILSAIVGPDRSQRAAKNGPDGRETSRPRSAPERVLVIGRERPGRPTAESVAEVGLLISAHGAHVDVKVMKRKREVRRATKDASAAGCDLVVAVGGDGLVQQVLTVLAGTKVALAIIPSGTGNLLAGNLAIPEDHAEAVRSPSEAGAAASMWADSPSTENAALRGRLWRRLRRRCHGAHRRRAEGSLGQARLRRQRRAGSGPHP